MKFTRSIVLAFAVASASAATAPSMDPRVAQCLAHCDPSSADYANCAAQCENVPHPATSNIADTLACSRKCDQGDGSPADTKAYGECLAACANQYYFSSTQVSVPTTPVETPGAPTTAETTTTPASSTQGGSNSGSTHTPKGSSGGMTTTKKQGPSSTKGGSSPSNSSKPTDGAAASLHIAAPAGGLVALLVAVFAL